MTGPKVSVAMATYNGERHIGEQLQSLAVQTRLPDELVVCDDGSTDGTLERIADFAQSAPFRVTVVRNEQNLGYNANFAKAISLCTGDIIFICDQDDSWYAHKVERVLAEFAAHPGVWLVCHDHAIVGPDLEPTGATKHQNIRRLGYANMLLVSGCCTALRKNFCEFAAPIPKSVASYDSWLNRLAEILGVRRFITDVLQSYRRHGGNASNSLTSESSAIALAAKLCLDSFRNPRADWVKMADQYRAIHNRIIERQSDLEACMGDRAAEDAEQRAFRLERAYRARADLFSMGWFARKQQIYRLYRDGFYTQFSGWKSALRDSLRF